MSQTAQKLYDLLPSVYRLRDAALAEPGSQGPLQAVLSVIAEQLDALGDDLDQLYDDQFIETCAEWVVPYIGDLIGARALYELTAETVSQRAQVANTIHYRRRKGTVEMLEELAQDVTGWPARAVEFFQLLTTTQYMNHLRPGNLSSASLRNAAVLELTGTPFDPSAHTADVRRIASRRGKYNIPNIGLFLWRLQPFMVNAGEPFEVTAVGQGLYTFHPLGLDEPLFNPAQSTREFERLAEEIDVPGALRRRPLLGELEARRAALAAGLTPASLYFGSSPVFQIFLLQPDTTFQAIDPVDIFICNLTDWGRPAADGQVMVDPVLGRLSFKDHQAGVRARYAYAFSAPLGGGPYDRQVRVGEWLPVSQPSVTFQVGVTQNKPDRDAAPNDPLFGTLGEAVNAWNTYLNQTADPTPFGVIAIMDSATYPEDLTIQVPKGAKLAIAAGGWPVSKVESSGLTIDKRLPGSLAPDGVRPVLAGSIQVTGTLALNNQADEKIHEFILDGLLVTHSLSVEDGDLGRLRISDCTLAPDGGGLIVLGGAGAGTHNRFLIVHIENSILGPLQFVLDVPTLEISSSIISSGAASDPTAPAVTADGADTTINTTTIFGTSDIRSLNAQNSIFSGVVIAQRGQIGCARYCYLPPGSRTARPYRCQPERAASAALADALQKDPSLSQAQQDAIVQGVQARVEPQFNSIRYGDPQYAQLRSNCAVEIRTGAEDDSELGGFHDLFQPQRESNLRVRLEEYLRFGLEAGIFFVT